MANNERQFEDDVFALMTEKLGWTARKNADFTRTVDKAMDLPVFVKFLKTSQPKAWARFEAACEGEDAVETLYTKFENAVGTDGIVAVLKDGFRAKGVKFAAYFPKPENGLCDSGVEDYGKNVCHIVRQWHYSPHEPAKSVDLMLAVNGIPLCAIELKDPFTGQTVAQAKTQWMTDRNPKEDAFRLNHRCIVFFAVDLNAVEMTTKLADLETEFLPFNQGSAGAGNDGGKGNPPWEPHDGEDAVATQLGPRAPTDYLWRDVLQKDSFLDIIQKFVNYDGKKKRLLFPRFHQLDVVRKLIGDVSRNGPGKNYLVQHSAGSGKSNSIAWVAYRLASLFNAEDKPMFNSVIIVTDRRVLDKQLQETVNSFNPKLGEVAVIDEKKHAKDLKQAIEDGRRIIVSTLQKFPVIFKDIKIAGDTLLHYGYRKLRNGRIVPYMQVISGRMVTQNFELDSLEHTGGVVLDPATGREVGYLVRVIGKDRSDSLTVKKVNKYNKSGRKEFDLVTIGKEDPSLVRGVPALTALRDDILSINKFKDNFITQSTVQNFATAFIEKDGGRKSATFKYLKVLDTYETIEDDDIFDKMEMNGARVTEDDGERKMDLGPGYIFTLNPGEHVKMTQVQPQGNSYDQFMKSIVGLGASVMGMSYETATNAYSASFSASRASINGMEKNVDIQRKEFAKKVCEPMWRMIIEYGILSGDIDVPEWNDLSYIQREALFSCSWAGVASPQVDPLKEVNAYATAIKNGLCTREFAVRQLYGLDHEEVVDRLKFEAMLLDGLSLSDVEGAETVGSGEEEDDEERD